MTAPRCPRCEGTALEPHVELLEASDERIHSTHRCLNPKCGAAFRFVPGTHEEPRRAAA